MVFEEKIAAEIAQKFQINEKTIRVWKSRNAIPDKYFKDDFKLRETTKAGDVKHNRFVYLLNSGTINMKVLSDLAGLKSSVLQDALRGKVRLSDGDLQSCTTELKKLKIDIARTFESLSPLKLKHLCNNPLIVYTKVLEDKAIYDKVSQVRRGLAEPDRYLFDLVKDKYIVFAFTLNI